MPLDSSFVGRTWPAETYEVSLEKIRERMAATPTVPEEIRLGRAMEAGGEE